MFVVHNEPHPHGPLVWPARWPPPTTCADPAPIPIGVVLGGVFSKARWKQPPEFWLPPLTLWHSASLLAIVIATCRGLVVPCRGLDHMALDDAYRPEFEALSELANIGDGDIEAGVAIIHARHPGDPFPAAFYDPEGRTGRDVEGNDLHRDAADPLNWGLWLAANPGKTMADAEAILRRLRSLTAAAA
jgi:hypothetical protein